MAAAAFVEQPSTTATQSCPPERAGDTHPRIRAENGAKCERHLTLANKKESNMCIEKDRIEAEDLYLQIDSLLARVAGYTDGRKLPERLRVGVLRQIMKHRKAKENEGVAADAVVKVGSKC
jgi:hypothetical protein